MTNTGTARRPSIRSVREALASIPAPCLVARLAGTIVVDLGHGRPAELNRAMQLLDGAGVSYEVFNDGSGFCQLIVND